MSLNNIRERNWFGRCARMRSRILTACSGGYIGAASVRRLLDLGREALALDSFSYDHRAHPAGSSKKQVS